jgi:hypothetical protein
VDDVDLVDDVDKILNKKIPVYFVQRAILASTLPTLSLPKLS